MPDFFTVTLRESVYSTPSELVVNEAEGFIDGVKIAGMESPNIPQGVRGCTKGTRYTDRAFSNGIKLYEGAKSDKNHNVAPRDNPHDSNPDQRIGWFTNIRHVPGQGVFGRYNLLKSDPLTAKVFEAAKRNPELFAMSHNAYGKGTVIDGWFVIDELSQVDSIDLCKDGGTTASLIESRKRQGSQPMKKPFRTLLLESTNPALKGFATKSHIVRLLEMDGLGDTVLDAPAPEQAAEMTWRQAAGELAKTLMTDEAIDPKELKAKLNALIKMLDVGDMAEPEGEKALEESDDGPPKKKDEPDDDKKDKEAKESRIKLAKLQAEKDVRKLCESKQFNPSEIEVERIASQSTVADREWLIDTLKGTKRTPTNPLSQGAGTPVKESQQKQPTRPVLR